MIFLRLAGGLGNQIFQLGAGLLFSEKVNCRKMLIDASDSISHFIDDKGLSVRI